MVKKIWNSKYFCGNKISDYGIEHKHVDYATLAKSFQHVLANDIIEKTSGIVGEWETVNGSDIYYEDKNGNVLYYDEMEEAKEELEKKIEELEEKKEETEDEKEIEESEAEISALEEEIEELEEEHYEEYYQYYIISAAGYEILSDYTNETVFYNDELDMYVWAVSHYGTSWDYVLTEIPVELEENEK